MKLNELLPPELFQQVQARIDEANAGQTDKTKHVRFADLSEGGYISVERHNSQINGLNGQIADLTGQISQRDTDITNLQERLTAAQNDASKLTEVQTQLTGLQSKYAQDQQEWAAKNAKQHREFLVREQANGLNFSSSAAKRDFLSQANAKDFQVDNDTLIGYTDFLNKYMAENPGALVEQQPTDPVVEKPQIVLPKNQKPDPDKSVFGFHFNGVRPKPLDT